MQNSDMLHSARRLEDACSAREDWWKGILYTCKNYEYRGRLKLSPTWISFTKLPFGGNRDEDIQNPSTVTCYLLKKWSSDTQKGPLPAPGKTFKHIDRFGRGDFLLLKP